MNKTDLVKSVAAEMSIKQADAEKIIHCVFNEIENALSVGDSVTLPGFGKFDVTTRAARTGRNPRTGESIEIAESKSVKFKALSNLKNAVQGS